MAEDAAAGADHHEVRIRLASPTATAQTNGFYFDELALLTLRRRIDIQGLEGGDILVLSEKVLVIGASGPGEDEVLAINLLAEALMRRTPVETIFVVLLPRRRAFMHLDTVFTQISEQCLVYPPFFLADGAEVLPAIKKNLPGATTCGQKLRAVASGGPPRGRHRAWSRSAAVARTTRHSPTADIDGWRRCPRPRPRHHHLVRAQRARRRRLARHGYEVLAAEDSPGGHASLRSDGRRNTPFCSTAPSLSTLRRS